MQENISNNLADEENRIACVSYSSISNSDYSYLTFDEETIRAVFGHEAAEDENIDNLKRYYVKSDIVGKTYFYF